MFQPDPQASAPAITQLLAASRAGDRAAADQVFAALYGELRRIAHRERHRASAADTLNTTAVVHEAYVRLMRDEQVPWESRAHLLGTAALAMRRLLVDRARARLAEKRGGGAARVGLETAEASSVAVEADRAGEEVLALDQALERLGATHPRLARVVELRFFGGLSEAETGRVLELDERTVRRDWVKAKAFLHVQLGG